MEIKFVDYIETPDEKHLGIVTVNYKDLMYLRFKVSPGKDGKGYFIKSPSYKVGENYMDAIMVDSRIENEKILSCAREGIKHISGN